MCRRYDPLPYLLRHWNAESCPIASERTQLAEMPRGRIKNRILLGDETHLQCIDECINMVKNGKDPITIIHGPPGTGKTTCLAEAIYQLHLEKPDFRILCVGPSHAAADNLCISLGKYFNKKGQLYRHAKISKITDEKVRGNLKLKQ